MKNKLMTEHSYIRYLLIFITILFISIFIFIPLISIFFQAFEKGFSYYFSSILEPDSISAIKLTLITLSFVVPLNVLFGLIASYAIARFDFFGKSFLITLIDIPFSVSPVISGLLFVLLFGSDSIFYNFLSDHDIKIIFSTPGIVLVTIFVTFPFVIRELLPVMQAIGKEEEEASLILGAGGWKTFFYVTFPNIKWALFYGTLWCSARAIGEFGAVSVVSGHIRGLTNTIPLHIEILYNEYNYVAAFAIASLLALFSIFTLFIKEFTDRISSTQRDSL